MRRWWWLILLVLLIPSSAISTGTLSIPNTIFTQPNPVPTSLLDANWTAIANYVNAREITFGVLASRPVAGTAGRYYFATDQNGGTFYSDTGTAWTAVAPPVGSGLVNQRAGLNISNNGSSTQSIAVGVGAVSSDDAVLSNRVIISLTQITTKLLTTWSTSTIGGVLQTNTGCLDTGTAATYTWYHVFVITRVDTGLVDILCSTSATAPTMPTNYTKKQRLGAVLTTWFATPGKEIYRFTQYRNGFRWATTSTTLDVNNATPGTNANTATLSVPNGVAVKALADVYVTNPSLLYVSDLSSSDEPPLTTSSCGLAGGVAASACQLSIITNVNQQIRYRLSGNTLTQITTFGWEELWD